MSILTDTQYLNRISGHLEGFVHVKGDLYNCRCIICGDSQTNKHKKRGYFHPVDDHLNYFCHKCGEEDSAMKFSTFLEKYFPDMHAEYIRDLYFQKGGNRNKRAEPKKKVHKASQLKTVTFGKKEIRGSEQDNILGTMMRVDQLSDDHICYRYVVDRAIPHDKHHLLYYAKSFRDQCLSLCEDDPELKLPNDERLIIPFFDSRGELKAVQGRALDPNAEIRYMTVKKNQHISKTYGDERVDTRRVNLVVEGPIDSLFLPNCRATADADLMTIPDNNTIYIPDNQYRERTICRRIEKMIDAGVKVVLFPQHIKHKDINDLCHPKKGNMSRHELMQLIASNVYSGLSAKLKFAQLRKC